MSIFNTNTHKPYWSMSLNKEKLMEKTPDELEKIGVEHGIDLDKRKKKETLVNELYEVL